MTPRTTQPEPDTVRIRCTSTVGALDVPALGRVVAVDEVVDAPATVAASLLAAALFTLEV